MMTTVVRDMRSADTVVVGGGIAGLAVAYHLARKRSGSVLLLEREPLLASHSSARNAAIFRPLDASPGIVPLALRMHELLDELMDGSSTGWLRRIGVLLVAGDVTLVDELGMLARTHGVPHSALDREALERAAPVLSGGDAKSGILLPDAGVIDIHAVTARLADAARSAGAGIQVGHEVARVLVSGGRVQGVELTSGASIAAARVLVATGAWTASVAASYGARLPLIPLRRHLVHLDVAGRFPASSPVVWRLDDEIYFREESGGVLASPCDEEPWAPSVPPCDPRALDLLARKLRTLAPGLDVASVRSAWACLRTFAPDRTLVAGPDPEVNGLFWLAGLGGFGMTVGVAAGEVVATLIDERRHPLATTFAPARLRAAVPR